MPKTRTLALACAFALGMAVPVFADQPGDDWMPMEQVIQKLKAAGYTSIHEMEADDGHWEGEGTKDGKRMEFHADPRTGDIQSEHPDN